MYKLLKKTSFLQRPRFQCRIWSCEKHHSCWSLMYKQAWERKTMTFSVSLQELRDFELWTIRWRFSLSIKNVPFYRIVFHLISQFIIFTHQKIILDALKLWNNHFCVVMQIEWSVSRKQRFPNTSAITRVNFINAIILTVLIVSTDDYSSFSWVFVM